MNRLVKGLRRLIRDCEIESVDKTARQAILKAKKTDACLAMQAKNLIFFLRKQQQHTSFIKPFKICILIKYVTLCV